jgi:hypothetical protein
MRVWPAPYNGLWYFIRGLPFPSTVGIPDAMNLAPPAGGAFSVRRSRYCSGGFALLDEPLLGAT